MMGKIATSHGIGKCDLQLSLVEENACFSRIWRWTVIWRRVEFMNRYRKATSLLRSRGN